MAGYVAEQFDLALELLDSHPIGEQESLVTNPCDRPDPTLRSIGAIVIKRDGTPRARQHPARSAREARRARLICRIARHIFVSREPSRPASREIPWTEQP